MATMPDLPDEILHKIIVIVGEQSVENLQPFVRAGKRSYRLVQTEEVLRTCGWFEVCYNALPTHPESDWRILFEKCVEARNPSAVYYEALRLATHGCDLIGACKILEDNTPFDEGSVLALGIFHCCLGNPSVAADYFKMYAENHAPLNSEQIGRACSRLKWELRWFPTDNLSTYTPSFNFPTNSLVKIPECVYVHYAYEDDANCDECALFLTARDVCLYL